MRDIERKYDKNRVEALPDVSDQLVRMEAGIDDLRKIVTGFLEKWGRLVIALLAVMAFSSLAAAMALITLAMNTFV